MVREPVKEPRGETLPNRASRKERDPERMCAVTREHHSPSEMLRFVAGPDDRMVPDIRRQLPGRGVWVTNRRHLVEQAVRQKAFARSLKRPVTDDAGLPDLVERLLARRALEALSIANKAGLVVAGFEKVADAIRRGTVIGLVHAGDASADGRRKLQGKLGTDAETGEFPFTGTTAFTTDELSLALGRPNVVHAAIMNGGAGRNFLTETERLERYGSVTTDGAPHSQPSRHNTDQV